MFHVGHLSLLLRARSRGDHLTVGVSTNSFNAEKGKAAQYDFFERATHVSQLRCVDEVIPETSWEQKHHDIVRLGISVLVMGSDWISQFDEYEELCEVVYLPRTEGISSTQIRGEQPSVDDTIF